MLLITTLRTFVEMKGVRTYGPIIMEKKISNKTLTNLEIRHKVHLFRQDSKSTFHIFPSFLLYLHMSTQYPNIDFKRHDWYFTF